MAPSNPPLSPKPQIYKNHSSPTKVNLTFSFNLSPLHFTDEKENRSSINEAEFSYKEVSELSEATEDVQQESVGEDELADLDDYDLLLQGTKQKMRIMSPAHSDDEDS